MNWAGFVVSIVGVSIAGFTLLLLLIYMTKKSLQFKKLKNDFDIFENALITVEKFLNNLKYDISELKNMLNNSENSSIQNQKNINKTQNFVNTLLWNNIQNQSKIVDFFITKNLTNEIDYQKAIEYYNYCASLIVSNEEIFNIETINKWKKFNKINYEWEINIFFKFLNSCDLSIKEE